MDPQISQIGKQESSIGWLQCSARLTFFLSRGVGARQEARIQVLQLIGLLHPGAQSHCQLTRLAKYNAAKLWILSLVFEYGFRKHI